MDASKGMQAFSDARWDNISKNHYTEFSEQC